jgi:hypothetical protein
VQKLGVVPPALPVLGAVHPVKAVTGMRGFVKEIAAVSISV